MAPDVLGALLGIGGDDTLQKLRISYRPNGRGPRKRVEALFNPAEIHRSRSVRWQHPEDWQYGKHFLYATQQFVAVEAESLTVELFFDTYESRGADAGNALTRAASSFVTSANPFAAGSSSDVTKLTDEVAQLARVDVESHQPPVCRLSWGTWKNMFTGVLVNLDQRFTMFLPDGTPVRATLNCTFTEYRTRARARADELHSADVVKTRTVRRGDTLHSLAAEEYNDPAQWRLIARANGVVDPLAVPPGTVLTIPRLDGAP